MKIFVDLFVHVLRHVSECVLSLAETSEKSIFFQFNVKIGEIFYLINQYLLID